MRQTLALEKTFSIRALPTWYGGRRYRSRTEARWAVFFDVMEVPFGYEEQGFVIRTADDEEFCYLPDFFIPPAIEAWPQWVEIKGVRPTEEEIEKLVYVCRGRACDGLLCVGSPDLCGDVLWCVRDANWDYTLQWVKGDFLAALFGETDRAFLLARSFRFERDERVARETLLKMCGAA